MSRLKFLLPFVIAAMLLPSVSSAQQKKTPQKKTTQKTTTQKKQPAKTTTQKPAEQKTTPAKTNEPAIASDGDQEKKVRDIIAFLEYMLNTLGSSETSSRDKDVLITQSYTKVFRDAKVQIEDDLDTDRKVITNKDVQAYLKDVDFFFKDVKFEFNIDKIKSEAGPNNKQFYKVSLTRNLKGTTIDNVAVNNASPRFIELNFNPVDQDLKIVSIYTRQFNEKDALLYWWKSLSYEWQGIFRKQLNLGDSVQVADIKSVTSLETLDLSSNRYIQDIEPLSQLVNLGKLNLSGSAIKDLTPLRNLTELTDLDISRTAVEDLSPLRYSEKLINLSFNFTSVKDISVLEKMPNLQRLEMRGVTAQAFSSLSFLSALKELNVKATGIQDLAPLAGLSNLAALNASANPIADLSPFSSSKSLTRIALDSTKVVDLLPLSKLENLTSVHLNYTSVSDLSPLGTLPKLERIYCDHTPIERTLADKFMTAHPTVLVIFDSEDMLGWWRGLSEEWHKVLAKVSGTTDRPTKEDLARLTNIDSINFSGNATINDLEPLRRLLKLKVIIADNTGFTDLSPLSEHTGIVKLSFKDTRVSDLSDISRFTKLKTLIADKTNINDINPISGIGSLEKLYVDNTGIKDVQVQEFLKKNPRCLVIYKSEELNTWWTGIPDAWQTVFETQVPINAKSKSESLHRLIELETIHIEDASVAELSPIQAFIRLKELSISRTPVADLSPIGQMNTLRTLRMANSPVRALKPIEYLTRLEELDISNTAVPDLEPLALMQSLKKLNCAGTPIKKLNTLEKLAALEWLDCSNTSVRQLDPLENLPLKTLTAYNTSVSTKEITAFKTRHPNCNVVYYR